MGFFFTRLSDAKKRFVSKNPVCETVISGEKHESTKRKRKTADALQVETCRKNTIIGPNVEKRVVTSCPLGFIVTMLCLCTD